MDLVSCRLNHNLCVDLKDINLSGLHFPLKLNFTTYLNEDARVRVKVTSQCYFILVIDCFILCFLCLLSRDLYHPTILSNLKIMKVHTFEDIETAPAIPVGELGGAASLLLQVRIIIPPAVSLSLSDTLIPPNYISLFQRLQSLRDSLIAAKVKYTLQQIFVIDWLEHVYMLLMTSND